MNEKTINTPKRNIKTILIILTVLTGLILFFFANSQSKQNSKDKSSIATDADEYAKNLEEQLEETINCLTNSTDTKVMITLDGGFENIYSSQTFSSNDTLFTSVNQTNPQIIKTKNPKIAGVMIVLKQVFDAESVTEIKKAAATCLNINENKIYIIGGTVTQ